MENGFCILLRSSLMCLDQVVCYFIVFICVCASAHEARGIGSLVLELQAVVSCPTWVMQSELGSGRTGSSLKH